MGTSRVRFQRCLNFREIGLLMLVSRSALPQHGLVTRPVAWKCACRIQCPPQPSLQVLPPVAPSPCQQGFPSTPQRVGSASLLRLYPREAFPAGLSPYLVASLPLTMCDLWTRLVGGLELPPLGCHMGVTRFRNSVHHPCSVPALTVWLQTCQLLA